MLKNAPANERLLTIEETVKAGRVSESTVRREIRDGRLRVTRLRGRVLVDIQDFEDWIERSKRRGGVV